MRSAWHEGANDMTMKRGLSAGALFLGVLSAGGAAQATTFLFTGTVQTFDVTTTGVYDITAYGAQGGGGFPMVGAGGLGAEIGGDVTLTAGSILSFLIGGSGAPGGPPGRIFGVGGGGGTFVVLNGTAPTLLAVAGGGGGGNFSSPGGSGLALASGDGGGLGGTGGDDHAGGGGGVGGSGETGEDVGSAALGGAGFNDGIALGGPSELSGGDGGGGGNFGGGGGGGYCGGDGGDLGGGGGGCSFLDSIVTEDVSLAGENINDGFVTISAGLTVPEPSTWAMMLLGFAGLSVVGFRAQRKTAAAAIN
jgi:PEP-CTERM motif